MGWRIRKTVKFGPVNINLSRSGIGESIGFRGFRIGRSATGKKYSQTSIPGTGIYRRDYYPQQTQSTGESSRRSFGSLVLLVIAVLVFMAMMHCA